MFQLNVSALIAMKLPEYPYRKHTVVCPDRGEFWNQEHSAHRLQIHLRKTFFAGIAAW
jgi:hypothetical protein